MDEKPERWDKELYEKLSFNFLIGSAENNTIDKWNALYKEYLESEWKRLYPEKELDTKNVVELVSQNQFIRPNFSWKDYREAISRGVRFRGVHLEGVDFRLAHMNGVDFTEAYLDGAYFHLAHLEESHFAGAQLKEANFLNAQLTGADFTGATLEGAIFHLAILEMVHFNEAYMKGAKFTGAKLDRADFFGAQLKEVNFLNAQLTRADFSFTQLTGVNFQVIPLGGAKFNEAHLEQTKFTGAHLEGTYFAGAHLEGADFTYAIVDGETMFVTKFIDEKTNFTGTALSATRIDPVLRTQLERNIREIHWEKWYKKPKFYPYLGHIPKVMWGLWCKIHHILKYPPQNRYNPKDYPSLENSTFYLTLKKVWSWPLKPSVTTKNASNQDSADPKDEKNKWETKSCWIDKVINGFVRLFWCLTDYGSSTKRVIGVFFAWNIFWAFIYQFLLPLQPGPILENASTMVMETPNVITAVMQTNLMMFSITDVATRNLDYPALIFVTVQIVIGYFILAALITRLGIMFQNLSP